METRQAHFRARFSAYTHDEAKDANSAIELLDNFDYDLVFLDHDLAEEHYLELSEGLHETQQPGYAEYSPGTGMDVVDHIVKMPAERRPKLAVVHSWNPRGDEMANRLWEAGVKAYRIRFSTGMYIPAE